MQTSRQHTKSQLTAGSMSSANAKSSLYMSVSRLCLWVLLPDLNKMMMIQQCKNATTYKFPVTEH